MTREQLEHAIRAACDVSGDTELIMFGSQATRVRRRIAGGGWQSHQRRRFTPAAQRAIVGPSVGGEPSRMAGLPSAEAAIVDDTKLYGYLLSTDHPGGSSKARFFRALGFTVANALELRASLLEIALYGAVVDRKSTPHGTKFVVDGVLVGSGDRRALLRTIWIQEGYTPPRLVTAYPTGAS